MAYPKPPRPLRGRSLSPRPAICAKKSRSLPGSVQSGADCFVGGINLAVKHWKKLRDSNKRLEEECQLFKFQTEQLRKDASENRHVAEQLRRKASENEHETEQLKKEASENQRKLEHFREEASENQREMEQLRKEASENQRKLEQLREEVSENERRLEHLRKQNVALKKQVKGHKRAASMAMAGRQDVESASQDVVDGFDDGFLAALCSAPKRTVPLTDGEAVMHGSQHDPVEARRPFRKLRVKSHDFGPLPPLPTLQENTPPKNSAGISSKSNSNQPVARKVKQSPQDLERKKREDMKRQSMSMPGFAGRRRLPRRAQTMGEKEHAHTRRRSRDDYARRGRFGGPIIIPEVPPSLLPGNAKDAKIKNSKQTTLMDKVVSAKEQDQASSPVPKKREMTPAGRKSSLSPPASTPPKSRVRFAEPASKAKLCPSASYSTSASSSSSSASASASSSSSLSGSSASVSPSVSPLSASRASTSGDEVKVEAAPAAPPNDSAEAPREHSEDVMKLYKDLTPEEKTHIIIKNPKALTIDRLCKLGEGSYGKVWKGTYLGLPVAVKEMLISSDKAQHAELIATLKKQRLLNHPNIQMVLGVKVEPQGNDCVAYICREYCPNHSLENMFRSKSQRKGLKRWPHRRRMCIEVAQAIAFLHDQDILHYRLKPETVLVNGDHKLKVAGFGVGKLLESMLTNTSSKKYDPFHTAPEVAFGEPFEKSADIYSLGILLYRLFTLRVPFQEWRHASLPAFMPQVRAGMRPKIPEAMLEPQANVLRACWHADKTRRPTAAEVVSMLKELPVRFKKSS